MHRKFLKSHSNVEHFGQNIKKIKPLRNLCFSQYITDEYRHVFRVVTLTPPHLLLFSCSSTPPSVLFLTRDFFFMNRF